MMRRLHFIKKNMCEWEFLIFILPKRPNVYTISVFEKDEN